VVTRGAPMIEAATILAAIPPAEEALIGRLAVKLAEWIPLFGVSAYAHTLIFICQNAWAILVVGIVLVLFGFLYPLKLPGDENKDNIDLGVGIIKTRIGGNARTVVQATGFIMAVGALIMIWKSMK
jgi:hypothetical protein